MTIAAQGDGLRVMAKKELVKIEIREEDGNKVFIMSQSIKGMSLYERSKVINRFLERETKVLEQAIENYLRSVFISYGIVPRDGSDDALQEAFYKLHNQGKDIAIIDRYCDTDERIIGERNQMTVILEEDILSAAIEVGEIDYEN